MNHRDADAGREEVSWKDIGPPSPGVKRTGHRAVNWLQVGLHAASTFVAVLLAGIVLILLVEQYGRWKINRMIGEINKGMSKEINKGAPGGPK